MNHVDKTKCDVDYIVKDRALGEVSYPDLESAIAAAANHNITEDPNVYVDFWQDGKIVLREVF